MELSQRKKLILKAVVEDYIQTAEPVSSKAIMGKLNLGVSSATIRNEMSDLEEQGYLEQPHTSAGRVPTAQGYRTYVNELMQGGSGVTGEEAELIERNLQEKIDELDHLVSDASKLTSQITALPSYALQAAPGEVTVQRFDLIYIDSHSFIIVLLLSSKSVQNRLISLPGKIEQSTLTRLASLFNGSFTGVPEQQMTTELIAATERAAGDNQGLTAVIAGFAIETLMRQKTQQTYVAGTSNLLQHPEYKDVEKAQKVLGYLSNEEELLKLPAPEDGGVKIVIGPENVAEALRDSSVVVAKYDAGEGMQGIIGVVGPTRMDYSRVAARLSFIAGGLAKALSMGMPKALGELTKGDEPDEREQET